MVSITVRDVPDHTYQRIKRLAERDRRSVNAEVIVAMDKFAEQDELQAQRSQALQRIIERRKHIPPAEVEGVELLREDRAR